MMNVREEYPILFADLCLVLDPSVAENLIKGLVRKPLNYELNLKDKSLSVAFWWEHSRQGWWFWNRLDDEILKYR